MSEQFPFLNRERELAHIYERIRAWGTVSVLCLEAPAGIGKTSLVHEVWRRCARGGVEHTRYVLTDIIDFDHHHLQIRQNVGLRLAQMLDEQQFSEYFSALRDWRRMMIAAVSSERLNRQSQEITRSFVTAFNALSAERRVILLFDSVDALTDHDMHQYLGELLPQFQNTFTLIAGRNAHTIGATLRQSMGNAVELLTLTPIPGDSSESEMREKQEKLAPVLDQRLTHVLLALANGQPVLFDFAVPERAQALNLTWLSEGDAAEVVPATLAERQAAFARAMVHYLATTHPLMDWLVLVMSCIYPLDVELVMALLGVTEERAREVFRVAQGYMFVKRLPDGRIALHDEVRHMVNEYVWPEIDPSGDRQRRDSLLAMEYLSREIERIQRRLEVLREYDPAVAPEVMSPNNDEFYGFLEAEVLDRRIWNLKEQLLAHTLCVDVDQGSEVFVRLFEEATYAYRFSFREALLRTIQQHMRRLSPPQRYEVDSRRVRHLMDEGKYLQAAVLATDILGTWNIAPSQQVEMLIQRGSAEVRAGRLEHSLLDFERAIEISTKYVLPHALVRALNARGWAYRHHGDFEQALKDYLDAYQRSIELNDMHQTAWILNNMGYANAFIGNQNQALENCWMALSLWEELGFSRGIGVAYSTLGEIYRRSEKLSESLNAFSHALGIFMSEHDVEWISTVRCGRASILWVQGDLEQAAEDLRWAWEHGPRSLKSSILFYEAQLYWVKGELATVRQRLEECWRLCQDIGDQFFDYASFSAFLDLAWELNETGTWRDYDNEHRQLYAERIGLVALRHHGSCKRKIADMAICHGDYAAALDLYMEGLPMIARYEVARPYTIGDQLKKIQNRILSRASPELLSMLGRDLYRFWRKKPDLISRYPEALLLFRRWEQEGQRSPPLGSSC